MWIAVRFADLFSVESMNVSGDNFRRLKTHESSDLFPIGSHKMNRFKSELTCLDMQKVIGQSLDVNTEETAVCRS